MRSGTTSAVVMTHGGVMMTILSAYGLPRPGTYDCDHRKRLRLFSAHHARALDEVDGGGGVCRRFRRA